MLIVVLALETLDIGASGVGFLNSAGGNRRPRGSLVVGALAARGRLATDFGLGLVLWGLPILLIGVWPEQALALVLLAVIGAGGTIASVTGDTLLQRAAPRDVLARVFGVLDSVLLVAIALGSITAPVLVSTIGTRGALIAAGALLPVLTLLTWRRLRAIDDAAAAVPERARRAARGLADLRAAAAPHARAARDARSRSGRVPAGEVVFRAGRAGRRVLPDRVRHGGGDGRRLARCASSGPASRSARSRCSATPPRTATIAAKTDLVLQVLDRDDFLGAVTGHPESAAAADTVVRAHLGGPSPASLCRDCVVSTRSFPLPRNQAGRVRRRGACVAATQSLRG